MHDDGLVSVHVHIAPKSSYVKVSDRVEQGQRLAKARNIGYSSGPHLHFELNQPMTQLNIENQNYEVVPAIFIDKDKQVIQIKYGDMTNSYGARSDVKRLSLPSQRMYW